MVLFRRQNVLRRLRNLSLRSITLIMVMMVIIANEYLVYWIQSWRWLPLPVTSRDPSEELVVLLVSDPQLIGIQDELGFPIGTITRWDSDRFLRKTFSLAHSYTQPDVVVFLGDLMDEGSKATRSEYESYFTRFQDIFYPSFLSRNVYIPGDNDIGGEGADFRTKFKISRFERHFENLTGVVNVHFIDFIKLDFHSQYDSFSEKKEVMTEMTHKLTAPIRILVNHEPVISQLKMLVYPLLKLAQPNLIFSGHWHEDVAYFPANLTKFEDVPLVEYLFLHTCQSYHYVCDTCLSSNENKDHWPVHLRDLRKLRVWTTVDFTNLISLNELMVPTCSYRMGTENMGYGVAVIRRSGSMEYTVLWLPRRYLQLYAYLGALLVIPFIVFILYIFVYVNKTHRR